MRNVIKALVATPLGIAGLGIAGVVAKNELHYWMQPSHLPILAVAGVTAASAGLGGTTLWAKKAIEKRKENRRIEELMQKLEERDALAPAQPQAQWSPRADKQVIDMTAPANAQRITRL